MVNKKNILDIDPLETKDWIESLNALIEEKGNDRAHYIIEKLIDYSRVNGIDIPFSANTEYINTIPLSDQKSYPGNRSIERRIKSIIRWNAMAMVVRANRNNHGIGGHISSFASSATLYEVGFNHFFKGPNINNGDLIYIQGHVSPGIYSRAFLEGRISDKQIHNFRRELRAEGGLSSYPHPWLMPNFWQFATVSMGLAPIMSIYQARFLHYLQDRGICNNSDRKVWAFLGDGEMDEPESMGAITLASREQLDNLIFVINCNLQRLDGPVRGNGRIVQELEGAFRGAGWNVIKAIWGSDWDPLFEKDTENLIINRLNEIVDGDQLKYIVEGGAYFRKHFWGKSKELLSLVEHLTDDELSELKFAGHDPAKVYAAYSKAVKHKGEPTVILVQTIKGYGLGESGEGRNITHQQKKLNEEELLNFRSKFDIPLNDEECVKAPFYKPPEDSEEIKYLKERRSSLGGYLPSRKDSKEKINVPPLLFFDELLKGSDNRQISTTMAFVRLLTILVKDKNIGKLIVPIIPDEGRTFGIDPLFRQIGIYSHAGQKYDPVDSDQFLYYREATDGQILEEGINECGAISSFIAAGTSHANNSQPMIPFFIFYSMFGFQRIGDSIWAAGDMRTKGFLIGGTAGKTTLNGEGLQHQDGHSHLMASAIPNLKSYDPAYAYEVAVIIQYGLDIMYNKNQDVFFYLTLENENYVQPKIPNDVTSGIIKGMYKIRSKASSTELSVQLLGSGPILNEVIDASKLLLKDWNIKSDVWSVTSYSELHKDAEDINRWNLLHPNKKNKQSYLAQSLDKQKGPIIACSDYVKLVSEQISPYIDINLTAIGTDGFGRSSSRAELRDFFEIDKFYIVLAAINALYKENKIDKKMVEKVLKRYNINSEKINPLKQ